MLIRDSLSCKDYHLDLMPLKSDKQFGKDFFVVVSLSMDLKVPPLMSMAVVSNVNSKLL